MHPTLKRVVAAYRPLYLNGLLRDGLYPPPRAVAAPGAPRRRGLLVALASLLHTTHPTRSKR